MLNYKEEVIYRNIPTRIKDKFFEGIKNRDFLLTLVIILIKTLLFLALLSDDKANGIHLKSIFFSMPPLGAWLAINAAFVAIGLFFNGKVQKWSFWTLNLLFTILVIGDMWYYRSNSVFLNYHMFSMTSNLDNLGSSIVSMVRLVDGLFLIDLVIMAVKNIKNRKTYTKHSRNVIGALCILLVSFSFLTYLHIKLDRKAGGFEGQFLFRTSWSPNQTMGNLTPIGYHIYDGYDFYQQSKPYKFDSNEKEEVRNTLTSLKENKPDNEYAGMLKGKNLLVIQWESLENCVINQKVDGQEITPNVNKLLSNSLYFNNFYEQTYGGTSSDAELMTNTSVFPVREGATFFRYPTNTYKYSLPNIFKNMGYSTLASHPDKGSYWNWMTSLRSMGYEKLLDASDYDTSDVINLGVSDESYLKQFGEVIKKQKSPYMAYTITLTSHSPFDMPENDRYLKLPENLEGTKLGGYFQSINYTDRYIGKLLSDLEESGALDNTVVVMYGDHEGVHKFYGDEVSATKGLEPWMEKDDRKIPLIVYNKDIQGKTFSVKGGQVDTLPTVAYLFGAPKEQYSSNLTIGRNLLNTNKDYALLSNYDLKQDGLTPEEQEKVKSLIGISDKMIRGNYYRDEADLND
ncbi:MULTISPECIES: LTA synthase family protein [Clostridium]|uniref:LTA synthase family protein n=1 Tax=Clostridium cibarium TaxID=2762247 RepID=A0ABR8PTI3_9CLOT|nr:MULTISPECIES: LTA synthase family protein [Clostridium]MBD7911481.1 LTA synthase family protein [Clostridium cibarium]